MVDDVSKPATKNTNAWAAITLIVTSVKHQNYIVTYVDYNYERNGAIILAKSKLHRFKKTAVSYKFIMACSLLIAAKTVMEVATISVNLYIFISPGSKQIFICV